MPLQMLNVIKKADTYSCMTRFAMILFQNIKKKENEK